MKIRLLEKNIPLQTRLRDLLSPIPGVASVDSSEEPEDLIQQLEQDPPSILIMNLRDFPTLKNISNIKKASPATTLILFIEHPSVEISTVCTQLGADQVLVKSTEIEKVVQIVSDKTKAYLENKAVLPSL
ncbi:MAG: response regulator transcription factor [Nitrospinae bacterium]|nr:response regulator transcription factor [Nitrospinota bacterium]